MSTTAQHYAKADELLVRADEAYRIVVERFEDRGSRREVTTGIALFQSLVAMAQVHATLATVTE